MRAKPVALAFSLVCSCSGEGAPVALPAQVFVADERAGTISAFRDGAYDSVTALDLAEERDGRAVRYLPHNVQASPDGRTVWATAASWEFYSSGYAGADDEQVIVLDAERVAVVARIPLRGLLAHVVFDAAGRFVYVTASSADQVIEIDATTRNETRRFRLGTRRYPHGARVCAGRLFVANTGGRSVSIVDLASGAVDEVAVGGSPVQVACARDGSAVFTALQDQRAVVRVTVATRAVERLALPESARGPAQVYLSPDGARLWVADQGLLTASDRVGNRVYEVDARAWAVRRSAEVGLGAHGVVVNRDGSRVYVSGAADHSVAVLDAATLALVAAVPVGRAPNGITLRDARGGMP